jgi:large subunit ribosomal protein L28
VAKVCYFCGKKPKSGNNVSHSNLKTKRKWNPNLQAIHIKVNGKSKKVKACTKCIKKDKNKK